MPVDEHGFQIFLGDKREPGEAMKHMETEIDDTIPHMANFLKAVKSRNRRTDGRCRGGRDIGRRWCTWPTSVTGWAGS